jgi:chromosome partitioning protein
MIVALCNQKGGVGKTTTTAMLTRSAVRAGLHTLAVDMDPQANLTSILSRDEVLDTQATIADALSWRSTLTLADVIVPTHWVGADIAPSAPLPLDEVRDEIYLQSHHPQSLRLKEVLTQVAEAYDLVLIDCPPELDVLNVNGINAADRAVIVVKADDFALAGMIRIYHNVRKAQITNPDLHLGGVLLNDFQETTIVGKYRQDELQQFIDAHPDLRRYEPPIPRRELIARAINCGAGLDEIGAGTPGEELAQMYDRLLDQIRGR